MFWESSHFGPLYALIFYLDLKDGKTWASKVNNFTTRHGNITSIMYEEKISEN